MYMDKISESRMLSLHPQIREIFVGAYREVNDGVLFRGRSKCRVACALRDPKTQNQLFQQGREVPGKIVTYADSWQSFHQYGLASDLVLLVDRDGNGTYESVSYDLGEDINGDHEADWLQMLKVFKAHGFELGREWSGKFKESPHVQMSMGYNWKTLYEMEQQGLMDAEGYLIL